MLEQYGGETIPSKQDVREEMAHDDEMDRSDRQVNNDLILNIYGQEAWHTEAKIVGSPLALQALKEALTSAISYGYAELPSKDPRNGKDALYASDGEGYCLEITCLGDWDDKRWPLHKPEYLITSKGV